MRHKGKIAFIYTLLHFLVDFTTIFLVSGVLTGPIVGVTNRGLIVIVYNLIAFAGQLPMGIVTDAVGRNRAVAAIGCILAGIACPVALISPWTSCVMAAIGNGAFHIGAGADILKMSMPKAGLPGLFVSSGALGVWLAYRAHGISVLMICLLVMLAGAVMLYAIGKTCNDEHEKIEIRYSKPDLCVLIAAVCFTLTVVIRSFLGSVMNFPWKSVPLLSFLFVAAVVGGKALGGYAGDRFGYVRTAIISLAISLAAFVFGFENEAAGLLGVLCFNMTMPLTLTAIAGMSGGKYGFAFGLTTFALAIGFVPVVFGAGSLFGVPLLSGGVLTSLVLMILGYKNTEGGK